MRILTIFEENTQFIKLGSVSRENIGSEIYGGGKVSQNIINELLSIDIK